MRGRGQVQKDYSGQFKDERLDLFLEHNPMYWLNKLLTSQYLGATLRSRS